MDIPECNYINPNKQNARDMNLNCVSNPLKGTDKYCKSEYKLYDPIAQRSPFLNIRRDIDAGYSITNQISDSKIIIISVSCWRPSKYYLYFGIRHRIAS